MRFPGWLVADGGAVDLHDGGDAALFHDEFDSGLAEGGESPDAGASEEEITGFWRAAGFRGPARMLLLLWQLADRFCDELV